MSCVLDWLRFHSRDYESIDHLLSPLDWDDEEHRAVINWEEDDRAAIEDRLEDRGLVEERCVFFDTDEKADDLVDGLLRRLWVQTTNEGEEFVSVIAPDLVHDERPELSLTYTLTRFKFRFMYAIRKLGDQVMVQTRVHRSFKRPNRQKGETTAININTFVTAKVLHDFV
jgi:hypothetical protein